MKYIAKQLEFNLPSTTEHVEGKCLDPQPGGCLDCVEDYERMGVFDFFSGNEMEGHEYITTVKTKNLSIEPEYDLDKRLWFWKKVSERTVHHREWWKNHN